MYLGLTPHHSVAAYSTNPCGHSCCGECYLNFFKTVPVRKPTCPVCRTPLDIHRPLIPNFTVDGIVRSHVLALADTGSVDWQPNGARHQDHAKRKECVASPNYHTNASEDSY
ncbi:hypothetical protein GY45DRAFT_1238981 [Cubamyces sp. BRFM 1775]|nr:hypothetical protein GY45DRAFT_1238981 [Cubamyces sp. BRFM 1775]